MDIETIVKLLKSDNEADYRIGYELALAKWNTHKNINKYLFDYNIFIFYRWGVKSRISMYQDYPNVNPVKHILHKKPAKK